MVFAIFIERALGFLDPSPLAKGEGLKSFGYSAMIIYYIMAVPKQRKTKSRRNQRRMHIFLETPKLTTCPRCGKPVLPHIVCSACGYYKGREVIDIMKKLTKKERKKKEKEITAKEKQGKKGESLSMEELSRK